MDRREAFRVLNYAVEILEPIKYIDDGKFQEALKVAIDTLARAVQCQECEHAWYRHHVPEAPYFCLINGHFHKGDFFCRNGKPKLDN